ncbi:hypothetical protein K8R03_04305 [Candidatus Kaiserbacteria bacterium]|nr:hypothetical protein [Candidatus Kaiserbacteria bacterium]
MVSTKRPPGILRLVDELDGSYPGMSLYDIVCATAWKAMCRRKSLSDNLIHLSFEGQGDGFSVAYYTSRFINPKDNLHDLPMTVHSDLKIEIGKTGSSRDVATTIRCSIAQHMGSSLLKVVADHSQDDRHTCFGGMVPGSRTHINEKVSEAYRTGVCSRTILSLPPEGKGFLARLALDFAIDWDKAELRPLLQDPVDVSKAFAEMVEKAVASKKR